MPRSRCAAVPVVRAALGPEVKEGFVSEVDQHNRPESHISNLGGKGRYFASRYIDLELMFFYIVQTSTIKMAQCFIIHLIMYIHYAFQTQKFSFQ